jgi:predicted RNase H-like HicB family nuclease
MLKRNVTYQAQSYEVVLVPEDDGGYSASASGVPGAYSDGDTEAEALENIADAIAILKDSAQQAAGIWAARQAADETGPSVPPEPTKKETAAD